MRKGLKGIVILVCACTQLFLGCEKISEANKAKPAEASGYLDPKLSMTEQRERYPFHSVWVSEDWPKQRDRYTKVLIPPVNLNYLDKMGWWQAQTVKTQESLKADRGKIANYIEQHFKEAIRNDPNHRFTITTVPGRDTLIAEFALVELIPSKAFFNAAATAGGFLVPGAGLLSAFGQASVAIEGRVKDSTTGRVLVQMADREEPKTAFVDVASMTWYDGAKDCVDDWAQQFVKLANSPLSEKIDDSPSFTLVSW